MFGLGMPELLVILFIVLLLFGARRLPDLAAGLGSAIHSFKKGMRGDEDAKEGKEKVLNAKNEAEPVPAPAKTPETTKTS